MGTQRRCMCDLSRCDITVLLSTQARSAPPASASASAQGLESMRLAHAKGIPMCYGSDLLGELHAHQLGEFALRARVLPNVVSSGCWKDVGGYARKHCCHCTGC